MHIVLVIIYLTCSALAFQVSDHIPNVPAAQQKSEVEDLIERTIGKNGRDFFEINIDKKLKFRSFQIYKNNNYNIVINGWDGVSAAKAFHLYLKYYLKHDITWNNPYVKLVEPFDLPNITLSSESKSPFIYYENVCTWGYSFAWWGWSTWRQHIDWMAMMGISFTIAPIQEEIWYGVYKEMGLTDDEILEYFAGPAFQPWQRMGNIKGWGGPLPASYRRMQLILQKRIIDAERALGITVALPAFAGHVPQAMQRIYPKTNFTKLNRWNKFPDKYCCNLFLNPEEALFQDIAKRFLEKTIDTYGSNHIYFSDPFNEIEPPQSSPEYMQSASKNIFQSMHQVDNMAIWLLQGWMFVKNPFWSKKLMKAFLTGVFPGKLLVLDLQSEQFPQYNRTNSYEGQPFIWCMLHNFGGTLGMHGSAEIINKEIHYARTMPNSSMVGVGISPEGIYQNYAMYALTLERAWVDEDFNLTLWFDDFADSRYGVKNKSLQLYWNILKDSVYSYHSFRKLRGKYTITRRPSLDYNPWIWYNFSSIEKAWDLLLSANSTVSENYYETYEHDLVDITRQYLQVMADRIYVNIVYSFRKNELPRHLFLKKMLLMLFDDLEEILATNKFFLLGSWIENAKKLGTNPLEKQLLQFNARNQITTWGPNGQIVDYACKQWSGLVRDYYRPRWALFLNMTSNSLKSQEKFNYTLFKRIVSDEIENPFSIEMSKYPTKAKGNTYKISKHIYDKWMSFSYEEPFINSLESKVNLIQRI